MLNDSDAVIFLLVNVVAVSAMDRPLGRLAPQFRELRSEQERELFVLDLVAVMEAEHDFAPPADVEGKLARVDRQARLVLIERGEHVPQPNRAGFVVIALHHHEFDFGVLGEGASDDEAYPPDRHLDDLGKAPVRVENMLALRRQRKEAVSMKPIAAYADDRLLGRWRLCDHRPVALLQRPLGNRQIPIVATLLPPREHPNMEVEVGVEVA